MVARDLGDASPRKGMCVKAIPFAPTHPMKPNLMKRQSPGHSATLAVHHPGYTALFDMAYTIAGFQRGELDAIQRKLREAAIAQSTDSLLPRAASAGVIHASTPSTKLRPGSRGMVLDVTGAHEWISSLGPRFV